MTKTSSSLGVWFALIDYEGNVVGTCRACQHWLDEPPIDTRILYKSGKPRRFVGTAKQAFAAAKAAYEEYIKNEA